ncbi:MAG: hypothetical protein H6R02_3071 [Burkholderiaceae bacterium]|jgi:predicted nucleotidyltransferase|nr:hypothetical protein [Burkholderiaceae bacterium]
MNNSAASLIDEVRRWADAREDIFAVALVGSYARAEARADSDVDLVIVCSNPSAYLTDLAWVAAFGGVGEASLEDWGRVQAARVIYRSGLEVEFGIAGIEWIELPPDRGTAGHASLRCRAR